MGKDIIDLKKELRDYRFDMGLLQDIPCSAEENSQYAKILAEGGKLPKGVFRYTYGFGGEQVFEFYTVYHAELSSEEVAEYLTLKKIRYLKTIRNCLVYFTVLSAISVALGLLWGLSII